MQPWQQVLAAVMTTITTLGLALKWFLEWLFAKLKERDDAFLKALEGLHKDHERQEESYQDRIEKTEAARLTEAKSSNATMLETMKALKEAGLLSLPSKTPTSTNPTRE